MLDLDAVKKKMTKREEDFSCFATKSKDAIRMKEEIDDIRTPFFRDVDRIIYSLSYMRYSNKTQVFSFSDSDHISKRMVHVQVVSKIARTIGRALGLNEDLIEASSLGHDIGHTPLGHAGEAMLNRISMRELGEMFSHNVQSVRTFMDIENKGNGINLSIQTLDGILCHNGEMVSSKYEPCHKTKEDFLKEYQLCYTNKDILRSLRPMTLEGCVVRISDIIGYLGRDIEDAIRLNRFTREEIPKNISNTLGTTNREIVNTIIMDIIENSIDRPYIKMSEKVFQAVLELKNFNYEHIYSIANSQEKLDFYERGMNVLFDKYLKDIVQKRLDSDIFVVFLNEQCEKYLEQTDDKRKVIDYLAGMTDQYLLKMIQKNTDISFDV